MTEILGKFQSTMPVQQARLLVVLGEGIGCGHACHQYGCLPNVSGFWILVSNWVSYAYFNATLRLADPLP